MPDRVDPRVEQAARALFEDAFPRLAWEGIANNGPWLARGQIIVQALDAVDPRDAEIVRLREALTYAETNLLWISDQWGATTAGRVADETLGALADAKEHRA